MGWNDKMEWDIDNIVSVTKYNGSYNNIRWIIIKTTKNDFKTDDTSYEWGAGLRGSGYADTYDECKKRIKSTIGDYGYLEHED